MSRDPLNLGGRWDGTYAYPGQVGPKTAFLADLEDRQGAITGTITEPNLMGASGGTLRALVRGTRAGAAVDFTKTYDGAADAAHSVDYVGHLSEDGTMITGVWSLDRMDGTFEMRRDLSAEVTAEARISEEVEAG